MNINPELFKNKKIIVTGGTGSIGSEIIRQLLTTEAAQIRIYSRDEHKQHLMMQELGKDTRLRYLLGDVRDKDRLALAFNDIDICFHAAALKHVPFCEYNPFEAIKTNILGTQNVIDLAIKHNLEKVIAISTDKAVNPASVLGTSKLMMEKLITTANFFAGTSQTKFASVRFGNVLNSRGSVIPIWQEQIKKGQPVTVTDERMTRFFMEIPQAVGLVLLAADLMEGTEVFVLKMKKVGILDLANTVIKKCAPDRHVPIKFIGMRTGDKLYEELLTSHEAENLYETEDLFIIVPPNDTFFEQRDQNKYPSAVRSVVTEYRSDR